MTVISFVVHVEPEKLLKGSALVINQTKAMFTKKMITTKRNWVQLLIQNIIPIWLISITIISSRSNPIAEDLPLLDISLNNYDKSTTVLGINSTTFEGIGNSYKKLFTRPSQELKVIETSVEDYILKIGEEDIGKMNNEYLFGVTFYKDRITGWFNGQGYHTAPLTINLIYNAILKTVCENCEIKISNKPLPFRPETRVILNI